MFIMKDGLTITQHKEGCTYDRQADTSFNETYKDNR